MIALAVTARLLFAGDVLLTREVAREIEQTGQSPWARIGGLFKDADLSLANLETAIGPAGACPDAGHGADLCFVSAAKYLDFARRAGLTGFTLENNHATDSGKAGRETTAAALKAAGLLPVTFAESPVVVRAGDTDVAVVAFSMIPGRHAPAVEVPSDELRRKLRLARRLAPVVVVFVHWGDELHDWVGERQERAARWLVKAGADLIVGAHPHVPQAAACVGGRPVYYSLGNHVFDQKYAETKTGLIADCLTRGGQMQCVGRTTTTPDHSSAPRLRTEAPAPLASCAVTLTPPLAAPLRGFMTRRGSTLLSLDLARFEGPDKPPLLFTVERHPSDMDGEDAPRPYVYAMTGHGLNARWRGSALAYPLIDATVVPGPGGEDRLCALHRGDSFIELGKDAGHTRIMAYRWNGFGFSGVEDPATNGRCAEAFDRGGSGT